jgi:hypothetical protein
MRRAPLILAATEGLAATAFAASVDRGVSSGARAATPTPTHDSMRVPPGWSARALQHPKRTRRPRLLFRVANDSVVVRVVEHPRGPISPAFPRARRPLVFDAHRRAGFGFAGYRFSIQIHADPGASARDLEWAEISARTLGVSRVGRG